MDVDERSALEGLPVDALVAILQWAEGYGLQAAAAVFLLHCVDYIEHYGLERQRLPGEGGAGAGGARQPMPYEKVQPWHSWNANWAFTNACAFRLQRHSDHHAHAERSFEDLRDMPDAPQLPMSYPARGRVGGEWVVGGVEGRACAPAPPSPSSPPAPEPTQTRRHPHLRP